MAEKVQNPTLYTARENQFFFELPGYSIETSSGHPQLQIDTILSEADIENFKKSGQSILPSNDGLFEKARVFYQNLKLIDKIEDHKIYLKPSPFFRERMGLGLNKAFDFERESHELFTRWNASASETEKNEPKNIVWDLLEVGPLTKTGDFEKTQFYKEQFEAPARALVAKIVLGNRIDWKTFTVHLPQGDREKFCATYQITSDTLQDSIQFSWMGAQRPFWAQLLLLTYKQDALNLNDHQTAQVLLKALYASGHYEEAAKLAETFVSMGKYKKEFMPLLKSWSHFFMLQAQKQSEGKETLQFYEVYADGKKQTKPITDLFGLTIQNPLSNTQYQYAYGKPITTESSYFFNVDVLAEIDGSTLSIPSIQNVANRMSREQLWNFLYQVQPDKTDLPVVLKILVDPSMEDKSLVSDKMMQVKKDQIAAMIVESKTIAESILGIKMSNPQFKIILGYMKGNHKRSHISIPTSTMYIDLEEELTIETLIHEWAHLLTYNLCKTPGPYVYIAEGLAMWTVDQYRISQGKKLKTVGKLSLDYKRNNKNFSRSVEHSITGITHEQADYEIGREAIKILEENIGIKNMTDLFDKIEKLKIKDGDHTEKLDKLFLSKTGKLPLDWLKQTDQSLGKNYGPLSELSFASYGAKTFSSMNLAVSLTNFPQSVHHKLELAILQPDYLYNHEFTAKTTSFGLDYALDFAPLWSGYSAGWHVDFLKTQMGAGVLNYDPEKSVKPFVHAGGQLVTGGVVLEGNVDMRLGLGLRCYWTPAIQLENNIQCATGFEISMQH